MLSRPHLGCLWLLETSGPRKHGTQRKECHLRPKNGLRKAPRYAPSEAAAPLFSADTASMVSASIFSRRVSRLVSRVPDTVTRQSRNSFTASSICVLYSQGRSGKLLGR